MKQIQITFCDFDKAKWVADELNKDGIGFYASISPDTDKTTNLTVKFQPEFLNYLCIRLFHLGQEHERKCTPKPQPQPLEFEGGQLNRTIELCQELDEIFSKRVNEPYSEGQAAAYKNITQYLQFLKRLNTL